MTEKRPSTIVVCGEPAPDETPPQPAVDEAWARCTTCGVELASDRVPEDRDHEVMGLVAGVATSHRDTHPDHEIVFGREPIEDADAWADIARFRADEGRAAMVARVEADIERMTRKNRDEQPRGGRRASRRRAPIILEGKVY